MANTCIICSGPAGSGEHVFPASLGGRRTNKNIYCTTHDNGYSSLVADLASQFDLFNALLGVRPDHGTEVKSVLAQDEHSGQMVRISSKGGTFAEPRIISQKPDGERTVIEMGFPDHQVIKAWLDDQKAKGLDFEVLKKGEKRAYILDTVKFSRQFGGPYGLGAVAYVSQTFLAQAFPDIVRSGALDEFKRYTQSKAVEAQKKDDKPSSWVGDPPVWWDFAPQPDQEPNAFEFGHRVTVGVDSTDGLIFGRISFFSTLHFSMIFGVTTDVVETKTVTVDIDPMADSPPNDIKKREHPNAVARVGRPASQTAGLASAITNGNGEDMISELMRRLTEFNLQRTAEEMYEEIKGAEKLTPEGRHALFTSVLEKRLQRIWNTASSVVSEFKAQIKGPAAQLFSPLLDDLVAFDASSSNGLSAKATVSLELARKAILAQMLEDHDRGTLDAQRLFDLIGNNPGAAIIGKAVLEQVYDSLKP